MLGRERASRRQTRRPAAQEPRPRSRWAAWLLAAFLICWAFVLGVLVGQGSLANPEQVAWVKQKLGLERLFGPETAPPPQRLTDPKLKFYDRVKQQPQAPPAAPVKPKAPAAPTAKAPAPAPGKPPTKTVAKAATSPEAKTETKTAAPAKSEAPPPKPSNGEGRFTVQVASFSEMNQALNLVRSLQDSGYRAYLIPVKVQGVGRRFRVRVGPYKQLDAAQGAASRIRLQHKLAAYVTRRE